MKTGLIYLASPYSNPDTRIRDGRFEAVCAAAARLMAEGHLIFSPIAHTHPIAIRGNLPTGWEFWMRYDHAQLDAAEELWVLDLPGWEESKGVTAEIEYMRVLGKEVRHITPTPEELALIPTTTLTPPPPASAAIPLCNRCHEHLVVKDGFCQFCTPPKQDDKALAVTRALASFSQNLERAWNGADGIWPDWMLRAREAKARVAELERALRPFAGLYDCIETTANEDGPAITETDTASVSIQCLRAARDALRKKAVAG